MPLSTCTRCVLPLLIGAASALGAQADPLGVSATTSVPVTDIRYEVRFDHATAAARQFHVSMTMRVGAPGGPVVVSLPAWTPGAYDMTYFARWVQDFRATQDGRELRWDKVDLDTWRVTPDGQRSASGARGALPEVTISYTLAADSLDTAMSWSRDDFAFFNGTNLFMYPEGQTLDFRAEVKIVTEPEWRVATGLTETAPRTYTASNYHDLVDMPTFVGRFDYDSTRISGTWVRFATYPEGRVAGATRQAIWQQLERMIPPQVAVFGEVPWGPHYTILQVSDTSYGGASGLEHQNSHLDLVTPMANGSPIVAGLYAHEIFHAWNVKRLRPAALWPYQYDRMQPTTLLWMSEGITDYYADLALVRGGILTAQQFYAATANKASNVALTPAVALEDASLSTWAPPGDGTGYIYYDKGSLVGLLLDVLIRDRSDNRASLDQVMRELYQSEYKKGSGFTEAEFWAAVENAAGRSTGARGGHAELLDTFRRRYIDGRDELPYMLVMPLAGITAAPVSAPRLGISTAPDGDTVRVMTVVPGSAAERAGVRVGDALLAVGDIQVTSAEFGAEYRAKYGQAAEGTPMPLRVRRAGETLTLPAAIRYDVIGWRFTEDPDASPKAIRIREGILLGRTAAR